MLLKLQVSRLGGWEVGFGVLIHNLLVLGEGLHSYALSMYIYVEFVLECDSQFWSPTPSNYEEVANY